MSDAVTLGMAGRARLPGYALRVFKDEKLAAMVTAGSDEAFATLYQRHHQAIYRYCRALLRQEADARDALQSSMLAALSSLRSSEIEGAFKPWLFRIAHNQSISIIRGRAREAPTASPPEASFSDDAETRGDLRTLVSDLAALPDRQRGAIVMRELSGVSYAEIAAAFATSEAGGKQLVYEARTALQELREGHEMSCELVRERISAGDRRLLRGRKVRSHLRGCQPCQDFERGIGRRRAAFAALAPPLPALAAAAVLEDVFGAGGASGGFGAGGTAASAAAGAASGGAPLAGTAALKFTAAALLAGAAGVGAYEAGSAMFAGPPASTSAAVIEGAGPSGGVGDRDAHGGGAGPAGRATSGTGGERGAGAGADTKGEANSGGLKAAAGSDASEPGHSPASNASAGSDAASGSGSSGSGPSPGGGGSGGGAVEPPPPPDPPPPPGGGGGGSGVAPGTPPGHGGTPPGQGGTPPGQAGGDTPPGHLGNPGRGGGQP